MADAAPRILLTGRPGCGKTTAVVATVRRLGPERCSGFWTEEVRARGRRIGFDVVTVDGHRGVLARVGVPGPRVGRYGVDLDSFERVGVAALEQAVSERDRFLVIDEIGKMELYSERFRGLLERVLGSEETGILCSIMRARHPVADRLRARPDIELIEVTVGNRDELPGTLVRMFEPWIGSSDSA